MIPFRAFRNKLTHSERSLRKGEHFVVEQLEDRITPAAAVEPLGSLIHQSVETSALGDVAADSFESGNFGADWSVSSSNALGRIRITDIIEDDRGFSDLSGVRAADGDFVMWMDASTYFTDVLNEAVLSVDLSGYAEATLSFSYYQFSEDPDPLPANFTGSYEGDGVAISDDGVHWHTVTQVPQQFLFGDPTLWEDVTIDLGQAAADAGMTLGPNFRVKFQQFDDHPISGDGIGWDNIVVFAPKPETESYQVEVRPGQSLSVAVDPSETLRASVSVSLPSGKIIATATASDAGKGLVVPLIKEPGWIAQPGTATQTYVVSISNITPTAGFYSAKIVVNAAAEIESYDGPSNGTAATAESLESSSIALTPITPDPAPMRADRVAIVGATDRVEIDEQEPNEPANASISLLTAAQNVDDPANWFLSSEPNITDSTTVPHVSIRATGDGTFDYYSFSVAKAGDRAVFDIDLEDFDSELFLYDASGNVLARNDDLFSVDPGSTTRWASYFSYTFANPGDYVIAVGAFNSFDIGGQLGGDPPLHHYDYTLHISLENHATSPTPADVYRFDLLAGETATIALTAEQAGTVNLELLDAAEAILATGSARLTNVDEVILSYEAPTTGTYLARVSGTGGVNYSLVVTRNAEFDIESNDHSSFAQPILSKPIAGRQWILGNVSGGTLDQYASRVIDFSSQYSSTDWSAAQALGEPDTFAYGDFPTAWGPELPNSGPEFITLGFDRPVLASGATIRETYGNGFVRRIDVIDAFGVSHTVWTGIDPSLPGTPVDFLATWPETTFPVIAVTIHIDTNHNLSTWEEIDSVQLHGRIGSDFYAVAAEDNQTLRIATYTPNSAGINTLDPMVRLYDAQGNLVAEDDNSNIDGNARLSYQVSSAGTYFVEVLPSVATSTPTSGDYLLSVGGAVNGSHTHSAHSKSVLQRSFPHSDSVASKSPIDQLFTLLTGADNLVERGNLAAGSRLVSLLAQEVDHLEHKGLLTANEVERLGGQINALSEVLESANDSDEAFNALFIELGLLQESNS